MVEVIPARVDQPLQGVVAINQGNTDGVLARLTTLADDRISIQYLIERVAVFSMAAPYGRLQALAVSVSHRLCSFFFKSGWREGESSFFYFPINEAKTWLGLMKTVGGGNAVPRVKD